MMDECVREISILDIRSVKCFVVLERRILGGYPLYVSDFDSNVIRRLTGKSAITREFETTLFVASQDQQDVARCAAIINPKYQSAKNEKVGFIGYFAAAQNCETCVNEMLEQAENWLEARGVQRIIAPFNGNANLGVGFLTAAFDEEPVMFASWNPPYYPAYLIDAGYLPTYPMHVFTYDFTSTNYRNAETRASTNLAVHVRPINKKRWQTELEIFRQIINDNFINEWEWYPMEREEFAEVFDELKPIYDPEQMLVAEVQGKPVGVRIGFPNWNPLARRFYGKLGVWEYIQFMLHGRRTETAGFAYTAVLPEHRGMGISPLLGVAISHHYQELGVKKVTSYFVNESNTQSRHAIESIGGIGRVLYHTYDKKISR
jgi:GNAT superfamily N-acetyltransferase